MNISSLRFRPILVDALKGYDKTRFIHDRLGIDNCVEDLMHAVTRANARS